MPHKNVNISLIMNGTHLFHISTDSHSHWPSFDIRMKSVALIIREIWTFPRGISDSEIVGLVILLGQDF